jgi:hypothetical protein
MTTRDPYYQSLRRELQDKFADAGLFLNWHCSNDEAQKIFFYGSNKIIKNGNWSATTSLAWLEDNQYNHDAMMRWVDRCFEDIGCRPDPYFLWTFVKPYRKDYMDRYPEYARRWREYKLEKVFEN